MGNIQCTRVSADLKIARSIVRLTEIQATLQDQRYFLIFYIIYSPYLICVAHFGLKWNIVHIIKSVTLDSEWLVT